MSLERKKNRRTGKSSNRKKPRTRKYKSKGRMTPRETYLFGVKFRSRTEARWSIVFNALEIPWKYEPQAFHLHLPGKAGAITYLPDFLLPGTEYNQSGVPGVWFEVKPNMRAMSIELKKARLLCTKTTLPVIVCYGQPRSFKAQVFHTGNTEFKPDSKLSLSLFHRFGMPSTCLGSEVDKAIKESITWNFNNAKI